MLYPFKEINLFVIPSHRYTNDLFIYNNITLTNYLIFNYYEQELSFGFFPSIMLLYIKSFKGDTMLPKDPIILLSTVNTKLRDHHDSLEDFCKSYNIEAAQLQETLAKVDFFYDKALNQFK